MAKHLLETVIPGVDGLGVYIFVAANAILRADNEIAALRAALLPFAAAAADLDHFLGTEEDDNLLALSVKVSAWKRAQELTGV